MTSRSSGKCLFFFSNCPPNLRFGGRQTSEFRVHTSVHCRYGWPFVAKFKNIIFSFKDLYLYSTTNIHSTSTPYIFIQHKYSFNFNSNYFHSTQIFIQYPFNFLQVPGHSKFPFNKTARPHPYRIEFCAHHLI